MKKKFIMSLLGISILALFFSCDSMADIDIDGSIYYGTGTYAQVKYIEFTVTGGSGDYDFYYARTASSNFDYAKSQRTFIGSGEEGKTYTYNVDGYVSTGWYYYIWAVDDNGASSGTYWHP
ncbi:MAG: hypothetical protein IJ717_00695 [Treponema sp.]|nr:hypothetical protein [Treponema sp.]